jgi:hypothetical protein
MLRPLAEERSPKSVFLIKCSTSFLGPAAVLKLTCLKTARD